MSYDDPGGGAAGGLGELLALLLRCLFGQSIEDARARRDQRRVQRHGAAPRGSQQGGEKPN